MQKAKWLGLLWIIIALMLAIGFTFQFGILVKKIPWSWERRLASFTNGSFSNACSNNPASQAALVKMLKRIYPLREDDQEFTVQVQVVRNGSINAFATLGGNIIIYEGLLKEASSAEELAGVLAHEIEHVRLRHILQGVLVRLATTEGIEFIFSGGFSIPNVDAVPFFLNMNFTKMEEAEADDEAIIRLEKSKVSLRGLYQFFKRMERQSTVNHLLSDHPSDSSRLKKLESRLDLPSTAILNDKEWAELKKICL